MTRSSYPAYIGKAKSPDWLYREMTYDLLGAKQRYRAYGAYVQSGLDDELKRFYSKGNQASVLSGADFRSWLYKPK